MQSGRTAFVVLQENNAIAVLDVPKAEFTRIVPLGYKAWADIDSPLDASATDKINLQAWNLHGMFQPDAIDTFVKDEKLYLVIANEGDAKEYLPESQNVLEWTEEGAGIDIANATAATVPALSGAAAAATDAPGAQTLAEALADIELLGDITVSMLDGGPATESGDVEAFDKVVMYGGRSFSILEVLPSGELAMVYDSGSELEHRHATHFPQLFNIDTPDGFCPVEGDAAGLAPTTAPLLDVLLDADDPEATYLELAGAAPMASGASPAQVATESAAGVSPSSGRRLQQAGSSYDSISDAGSDILDFITQEFLEPAFEPTAESPFSTAGAPAQAVLSSASSPAALSSTAASSAGATASASAPTPFSSFVGDVTDVLGGIAGASSPASAPSDGNPEPDFAPSAAITAAPSAAPSAASAEAASSAQAPATAPQLQTGTPRNLVATAATADAPSGADAPASSSQTADAPAPSVAQSAASGINVGDWNPDDDVLSAINSLFKPVAGADSSGATAVAAAPGSASAGGVGAAAANYLAGELNALADDLGISAGAKRRLQQANPALLEALIKMSGAQPAAVTLGPVMLPAPEPIEVPPFLTSGIPEQRDGRSPSKGPEPETVVVAEMYNGTWLFVANERPSTVFLYDLSDPRAPQYHDGVFGGDAASNKTYLEMYDDRTVGDIDPEGLTFVPAADSPNGRPLLIVAAAESGSVSVYEVVPREPRKGKQVDSIPCSPADSSGGQMIATAYARGISLSDLNPSSNFSVSYPPKSRSILPSAGTFGHPADAAADSTTELSVPAISAADMLSGLDCAGRAGQEPCADYPGLFSGLTGPIGWCVDGGVLETAGLSSMSDSNLCQPKAQRQMVAGRRLRQMSDSEREPASGLMFLGITDRGPNQNCAEVAAAGVPTGVPLQSRAVAKGFPTPDFSPALSFLHVDVATGAVQLARACPLQAPGGEPVSGISSEDGDPPFSKDCGEPLARDPLGVDPEEVQPLGDSGWCLVVEEYTPSVMIVRCDPSEEDACGTVAVRLVPEGTDMPDAPYEVQATLPKELRMNRRNRGFEAAAVAPDGSRAFIFVQSPLDGAPSQLDMRTSTALRVLRLAIKMDRATDTEPPAVEVRGQYIYQADSPDEWDADVSHHDVAVSAAAWLDYDKVLVLERNQGQVKLYDASFTEATNLMRDSRRNDDPDALAPDMAFTDGGTGDGIEAAKKTLVMDSKNVDGWSTGSKQEGLAIVNACVVALGADNDFGLSGNDASAISFVQLGKCLPQYSSAIYDGQGEC